MSAAEIREFRELCEHAGLAATHQRQVIYEILKNMHGHPSPEEVYARVKRRIPSISLATVYKNIHLFIESGVFHEVSLHHGSLRVETNHKPHHHLVCTQCKSITDIDAKELGLGAKHGKLPGGFLAQRYAVDVLGLCAECQRKPN
ncbi:MAG TPA: Fur family transcriptional regulator [Alloacidobacterium sp.]|nr:Fur family transcriptional regulator [Alloacidobacterium sp.]